ncbi:MAG: hypothetical protein A2284_00470 [Deltaproteobacteria bacterium RIFOXYA12_FULL_61_11]|nr:MAG: hypothetical protein A2284_00470 [Deltaproteobacteria bacterium RIFOXYA12_FULL_61_11]
MIGALHEPEAVMKSLITITGSRYDATVNSCYAILKRCGWTPDVVEVFHPQQAPFPEHARKAAEALSVILEDYHGHRGYKVNLHPFEETDLVSYSTAIEGIIKENFNQRIETAVDITCGRKVVSGVLLKTASVHRNKILHIFCVYVKAKAYFDRWYPLRPANSQDVMDLMTF